MADAAGDSGPAEAPYDAVEELFSHLPDPDVDRSRPVLNVALDLPAITNFLHSPLTNDHDHLYLQYNLGHSYCSPDHLVLQMRQWVAFLAAEKNTKMKTKRKNLTEKARQLKYYKWIAQGKKSESYPSGITRNTPGLHKFDALPSTTKLADLCKETTCAACKKPNANMRCPDCNLIDDQILTLKTVYCNKTCLKNDQDNHEKVCNFRKMTFRVTKVLQMVFTRCLEVTLVEPPKEAFEQNGILYWSSHSRERAAEAGRSIFAPFPKKLRFSDDVRQALLMWRESHDWNLRGDAFAMKFLLLFTDHAAFLKSLEQVVYFPKNILRPTCQLRSSHRDTLVPPEVANNSLILDTVWRLTLGSGEVYALNLTAAQFGWKEVLAPWKEWAKLRIDREVHPEPARNYHPGMIWEIELLTGNGRDVFYKRKDLRRGLVQEFVDQLHVLDHHASFFEHSIRSDVHVLYASDEDFGVFFAKAEAALKRSVAKHKRDLKAEQWKLNLEDPSYGIKVVGGDSAK